MSLIHSDAAMTFKCDTCNLTFPKKVSLTKHYLYAHDWKDTSGKI